MIVQVHDHKSTAPAKDLIKINSGPGKTVPFSIHNNDPCLTPSPYVPFPTENGILGKIKNPPDEDGDDIRNLKGSEQKDKENMPAPTFPDGQRSNTGTQLKEPKVFTIVLHPTPLSNHADLVIKASTSRVIGADGRIEARDPNTVAPSSATAPPTPSSAVPPTPHNIMAPPAKRVKRSKMELDSSNIHALESQIALATTAPLVLEPASSILETTALLDSLAHPLHSEKPPSPKTRKRTVAEMAADEALAVQQERYMLTLDERLSSSTAGVQSGANPVDGDGQAGGGSFEPRFERFKTLENIRKEHEEKKINEKARQQEVERKNMQDRERERLRQESDKRDQENRARIQQQQQAANARMQQQQQQQQQEAHRRAIAAQQQQSQTPQQNPHPQGNGIVANGLQSQPQRFHQQVSQAQISSPVVRNGTPQNHSSPIVNSMGNIPMQHTTSSMGGSPPRPGSVVNPQMGGPTAHAMTSQRSQQSHGGTPRVTNATPNLQSTPLNRQMSQTPRMSQASPLQGQIAQAPHIQQHMMMNGQLMNGQIANGQMMNMNATQQQQFLQQQQQQVMAQRLRASQAGMNTGMSPQQFANIQQAQAHARAHQQQGNGIPQQLAQDYVAQMNSMAQRNAGMPQNMNFNSPGMPNMQQIQHMQQMQQIQNAQAQAQAQQQQQLHMQNPQAGVQNAQQVYQARVLQATQSLYQLQLPQLQQQYPGGIPEDALRSLKVQCQQQANVQVQNALRRQRAQHQMLAQQQQQQQGGMQHNGMNGMGMQRPQGM